jgi:hypothetical protein
MNRIPYNYDYYNRSLLYVSGKDSVLFAVTDTYRSKKYKLGGLAVECSPELSISRQGNKMSMDHSFNYTLNEGNDKKTKVFIYFNCSSINIDLDSLLGKENKEIELTDFQHYGNNKGRYIRKAKFQKMFFTEIEEYSGKIWKLVKVGDSIINNETK